MKNSDFNLDTSASPQHNSDDISLFLRQLIHRSSSSSSTSSQPYTSSTTPTPPMNTHAADHHPSCFGPHAVFTGSDRLVVDRISPNSLNAVVLPPSSASSEPISAPLQFRSFDHSDFAEDNDYESEEGNEVAVEEMDTKQQLSRCNHSKRTRAAEVHNLSEKRRRSRINEKMKALQNLIPNSNKTDKASMLDEAIEYLKQLQLQVQMLSMRNGLSLHPMCLPGGQGIMHPSQLSQMGIEFDNGSGSYDINVTNALNTMTNSSNSMLNLSGQCTSSARPSLPIAPTIINNSESMSFGLEPCVPSSFRPFQLRNPQAVRREQSMPHERLVIDNNDTTSLEISSTRPFPFGIGDSGVKGHNSAEELVQQKHAPRGTFHENSAHDQLITSNISGMLAVSSGAQMTS